MSKPDPQRPDLRKGSDLPRSGSTAEKPRPLHLKYLTPGEARAYLTADPRLIVPVGVIEQHGPHLPLGTDTIIVERLANDLSAEFQVVLAPTVEYGVNASPSMGHAGSASLRRKTLHRFMNDLIGSWESSGVEEFIILTANGYEPHQEALTTLHARRAAIRTVDIFGVPLGTQEAGADLPIHGGQIDTSLLLHLEPERVALELAEDFIPSKRQIRRYRRGTFRTLPGESPGSIGRPSLATSDDGAKLYEFIYSRIASHIFGPRPAQRATPA